MDIFNMNATASFVHHPLKFALIYATGFVIF